MLLHIIPNPKTMKRIIILMRKLSVLLVKIISIIGSEKVEEIKDEIRKHGSSTK